MRAPRTGLLALALALLLPAGARPADPPTLGAVRIGLPAGQDVGRSRDGAWAPVYVRLRAGTEGHPRGGFQLVLETTDGDDVPYRYTVPVPALGANDERDVVGYLRPGSEASEVTVRLQSAD